MGIIKDAIARSPKLQRGQVWCTTCSRTLKVDPYACFAFGWPKCCGYTMTVDSPEERREATEGEADG